MTDNTERKPVKVAVVGTGFGRLTHVPGYRTCSGVQVQALVGSNLARTRAYADELDIPLAATNLDDVLESFDIDLVSIASPVNHHFQQSMSALTYEKHLVVEKPLALNSHEAEALTEMANRQGVINVVDTQLRFNPTRQYLKQLVDDGFLGRPYHIAVHSYHDYRGRPWSWKDTTHNGVLRGHASHMIDLVQWIFGPVDAVLGSVRETMIPEKPDSDGKIHAVTCEDFATFVVRMSSGAIATFLFSSMAIRPRLNRDFEPAYMRLEAFGEQGSLVLDIDDRLYGSQSGQEQWTDFTQPEPLLQVNGLRRRVWDLSFARLAQTVISALRGESPITPAATFQDGLTVIRILDDMLQART